MIEGVADSSPDGSSPEIRVVCDGMPTDDAKGDFCLPGVAQEDFNKCNPSHGCRCTCRISLTIR